MTIIRSGCMRPATCARCVRADRRRWRLHAVEVLLCRLALLTLAGLLVWWVEPVTLALGALVGIWGIGAAGAGTFRSFARAWKGKSGTATRGRRS
jgi:uncharacterized membrane protein YesL